MDLNHKLSENLKLKEVIKSNTATRHGIDNTPTPEHLDNLEAIANAIFQPVRSHFGKAIGVSSGYRTPELNEKIKGSDTSQHCKGEALDLDADIFDNGITNKDIFEFIRDVLPFDQLIWEYGDNDEPDWVHVSYKKSGPNQGEILRAKRLKSGKVKYYPFS